MNKEQEISRRKQNHKTQTISDCPIQEAQQEVWWGTSFAKYELLFSPLIYFNFYPKITMPLKKKKKKIYLNGVEMFVCLLLQAERGLNTSQANSQDSSYFAGMPHAGN